MTRRVLIDSNVFIEYFKGNKTAANILDGLMAEEYELFINGIVYSEVLFIFLTSSTGLSAKSLKKKPELVKNTPIGEITEFLGDFKVAEINDVVLQTASRLLSEYGLLPNDAIILTTAKIYEMDLATMDRDFQEAAKGENVELITQASP